ncbi:hypothetical protein D3C76_838690 [compost metagenome]
MFDLQAGVHLHEEELAAGIEQELHRARTHIADGLGSAHRGLAHGLALRGGQARGRGFFDHFLVAALDRAVTFVEVQAVAVLVGEHLDFYVAWLEYVLFHQHASIAKRRLRLTLRRGQGVGQLAFVLDHFHAFAATTGAGLEQHRVADAFGGGTEGVQVLGFTVVARHQRHAGRVHQGLGRRLAAHRVDGAGRWAEEDQPGVFDGAGKACVFGKKAIARVDGLGAAGLGRGKQFVHQQVAFGGLGAAEVDADIGFAAVPCVTVGGAVHGNGGQAHGLGGAHHPAGNLAAVGDQQGGQRGAAHGRGSLLSSVCQAGRRFSRKARRPSWPSALTRMRAMVFSQ